MTTVATVRRSAPYHAIAAEVEEGLDILRRALRAAAPGSAKARYYERKIAHLEAQLRGAEAMIEAADAAEEGT